jgi:hypothetical protein
VRATLHSSHVTRDFSDGQLTFDIVKEDARLGVSRHDRVHFSVPRDYHVHHDSVAAALLTLLGRTCAEVTFNFPISERCAELLTNYYRLAGVGPVDPALEPRRPGRHIAINFSGGVDSTALLLLMQEVLGDDVRVISIDFGGRFAHERRGFRQFRRDVTCRTDLRQHGYDQHGRFIASVALLYADYLELSSVANGHTLMQETTSIVSRADGRLPDYRQKEPVYLAGGLAEEHLVRGLTTLSMFKIILDSAPERLEDIFAASAQPNTEKYYSRALLIRYLLREAGLPLPAFLQSAKRPSVTWEHSPGQRYSFIALWMLKHDGPDAARSIVADFDQFDFGYLDELALNFFARYNTNLIGLLPDALRPALLTAYHKHGIYPYTERDWHELDIVREQMFEPGAVG